MILQTDIWNILGLFFNWVAQSAGIFVFLSSFMALSWLGYERKRRGSFFKRDTSEKKFDISQFLKGLSYLGLILGIFTVWAGAMSLILDVPPSFRYGDVTENGADHFTSIYLIVIGIVMFLKPISDLPLSSIFALIIGIAVTSIVTILVPDTLVGIIGNFINPKIVLFIIFIVVTTTVGIIAKFYIDILVLISKILSWPPIAFGIMVFSFVQGIALWGFGISIVPNIL